MKNLLVMALAIVGVFTASQSASALSVSVSSGVFAMPHSSFTKTLSVAAPAWLSGTGTLTFTGIGDYDDLNGQESVNLSINGGFVGTASRSGMNFVGNTLTQQFTVSEAIMATIDGINNLDFTFATSKFVSGGSTVSATLDYNAVPEPTTLAILGLGALGAVAARRRRK